jgi:hypothetical protein
MDAITDLNYHMCPWTSVFKLSFGLSLRMVLLWYKYDNIQTCKLKTSILIINDNDEQRDIT